METGRHSPSVLALTRVGVAPAARASVCSEHEGRYALPFGFGELAAESRTTMPPRAGQPSACGIADSTAKSTVDLIRTRMRVRLFVSVRSALVSTPLASSSSHPSVRAHRERISTIASTSSMVQPGPRQPQAHAHQRSSHRVYACCSADDMCAWCVAWCTSSPLLSHDREGVRAAESDGCCKDRAHQATVRTRIARAHRPRVVLARLRSTQAGV
jgi:hypothetical protein